MASKGAIRIKADPGALASRNMTFDDLSAAIRAGTSYSGAGQFDGKNKSIILRPNGQIEDAEGYRNLIIARGPDNAPVYLRDVAKVVDERRRTNVSRVTFLPADLHPPASVIVLAVSRQAGANAVEVARSITRSVARSCACELPGSINLIPDLRSLAVSIVHSRPRRAGDSLHRVRARHPRHLRLSSAAPRDTLIPVVALPLSFLITFLAMWALDYSINNLTLMALTLAIGFLVDDAIVFLENVVRRAEARGIDLPRHAE